MESVPTKPTGAATVEVALADDVVVEKEGDAPDAPLAIKGERTVEVAVVEELAVAPALVAADSIFHLPSRNELFRRNIGHIT
jgi:hypothetical protein